MTEPDARERWAEDRTTFQRVYDVLVGETDFATAAEFADRADCSETAARNALEQLVEMGIAERREGRPAGYRRNASYVEWKRVEALASDHRIEELVARVEDLVEADEAFQERFGAPEPAAVSTADLPVEDQDAAEERWAALNEWRTVRRDVRLVRRAIDRARSRADDGVSA
ncbi:MAG: helix-turn-helix domain-containing protein [Halobacteriaceae archaeon]